MPVPHGSPSVELNVHATGVVVLLSAQVALLPVHR